MNLLTHEARRIIVTLLRDRELTAGEIADALSRPRPGVSHHVTVLLEGGIVECRVAGSYRYYRLNPARTLEAWDEHLRAQGLVKKLEPAA